MPPSVDNRLPTDQPSNNGKRIVRRIMHIWHLITALLFLLIVIFSLAFGWMAGAFVALYLLPLIIYIIAYSLIRLFDKEGKKKQTFLTDRQFGIFAHIRFRGFVYQAVAALLLRLRPYDAFFIILAWIIWVFGVLMFVLGWIAKECGILDWVQEDELDEEEEEGRLILSDDEDEGVDDHLNVPREESFSDAVHV